jgi:hypothetical protein
MRYYWNHDNLVFKGLIVPKPNECQHIVMDLHNEIGHFGEGRMLAKINKCYFWHNRIDEVKSVVRFYKQCWMVK